MSRKNLMADSLLAWLQRRKEEATMALYVGKNLNPFYLPDFIERHFNLAKEFPLWTSATISYNTPLASSSYVEGYFNDLKIRVLKNTPPPLRVDKFIKIHIRDILGQTLLFSSKVITFNQRTHALNDIPMKNFITTNTTNLKQSTGRSISDCNQNPSVKSKVVLNMNDSDLMAQENWRGKALNEDIGYTLYSIDELIETHALNDTQIKNFITTNTTNLKHTTGRSTPDCNQNPSVIKSKVVLNMNDSDLIAQENWREKSLNEDIGYAVSIDESTESSKVPILTCTQIHCTENSGIQSSIESLSDHSYCKNSELNIRQDCSTLQHTIANSMNQVEFNLCEKPVLEMGERAPTFSEIPQSCDNDLKIKKKKTKYYELYPEVRQRNLLTANTKKPFLLLNGGICKLPLKIDGVKVFLKSTCAFDSLIHIIMTGALDDPRYAQILEKSSNATLQFTWTLINTGLTKEIYLKRAMLLKHLRYPCIPEVHTTNRILSYSMNALDSIANVVKRTLDSYPSVYILLKIVLDALLDLTQCRI
ncbi:hypothetical protein ACS0PU_000041 [Formica fusca]